MNLKSKNRQYKFALVIICGLMFSLSFSQTVFIGKLLDSQDATPISGALISDHKSNQSTESDAQGKFTIETNGILTIEASGYMSLTIDVALVDQGKVFLDKTKTQLDEVLIKTTNIPQPLKLSTIAVSSLSTSDLRLQNDHDLSSILNSLSGIFMQSGTLNTNRISIRGIGARNLFGTAMIRAYFGDIPLTDGNGESSIEDLELQSISSLTVFKGPSASTFGVGLGGAILLDPDYAKFGSSETSASFRIGSYGFQKSLVQAKIGLSSVNFNVVYSNTKSNGYRLNNGYNRKTLTVSSKLSLDERNEFSILGSYIKLNGGIPSSLSLNDYAESPRKAAFTWGKSKAFEDVTKGLMGANWKHRFKENLILNISSNLALRENYEPRPFNILSENSKSLGLRSRLNGEADPGALKIEYTFGGELFYEFYENATFENLYNDFDDGRGSVKGFQLTAFNERRNYINAFAESNIKLNNNFLINLGLHVNKTHYKVDSKFENTTELEGNGVFKFNPILSPKIGFSYKISESIINFGNISHGFSPPTTSETLLPDGLFNSNLRPEIGWNFETGLRYKLFGNRWVGSTSIYRMKISDLLVTRRTPEGDFFAINAGEASYNGLESAIKVEVIHTDKYDFYLNANLSLHDYKFDDFIDDNENYSNNRIPGVPEYVYNLEISLIAERGLFARLALQGVGDMAASDANVVFSQNYKLLNAKIGYDFKAIKSLNFSLAFSGQNVLNEKYASQLQINAIGFGDNLPRYFYPGLPVNFYASISVKYKI